MFERARAAAIYPADLVRAHNGHGLCALCIRGAVVRFCHSHRGRAATAAAWLGWNELDARSAHRRTRRGAFLSGVSAARGPAATGISAFLKKSTSQADGWLSRINAATEQ